MAGIDGAAILDTRTIPTVQIRRLLAGTLENRNPVELFVIRERIFSDPVNFCISQALLCPGQRP